MVCDWCLEAPHEPARVRAAPRAMGVFAASPLPPTPRLRAVRRFNVITHQRSCRTRSPFVSRCFVNGVLPYARSVSPVRVDSPLPSVSPSADSRVECARNPRRRGISRTACPALLVGVVVILIAAIPALGSGGAALSFQECLSANGGNCASHENKGLMTPMRSPSAPTARTSTSLAIWTPGW